MTRRLKLWDAYWAAVATLAILAGGWVYYRSTRPFIDCIDGHCPDPGSREYLSAVQRNIDTAPQSALAVLVLVLMPGVLVRAFLRAERAVRRRLSGSV